MWKILTAMCCLFIGGYLYFTSATEDSGVAEASIETSSTKLLKDKKLQLAFARIVSIKNGQQRAPAHIAPVEENWEHDKRIKDELRESFLASGEYFDTISKMPPKERRVAINDLKVIIQNDEAVLANIKASGSDEEIVISLQEKLDAKKKQLEVLIDYAGDEGEPQN